MTDRSVLPRQRREEPSAGGSRQPCVILREYLRQDDPVGYVRSLQETSQALKKAQNDLDAARQRVLSAARRKVAADVRAGKAQRIAAETDDILTKCASEVYDARRDASIRLRDSRESLKLLSDYYTSRISRQMALIRRLQLFCNLRVHHESTLMTLFNLTGAYQMKIDARNAVAEHSGSSPSDDKDD